MSDLWCVHVIGPDDVMAAPDYDTALRRSYAINEALFKARKGRPLDENDPLIIAHPDKWPWSEDRHTVDLAKQDAIERAARIHQSRRAIE